MAEEIVDIIDEHERVLYQVPKSEAHRKGLLHKIVIGYLRDDGSWRLVRQAGHKQDARQLVAPVGGHVSAGESEAEALLREAGEEIGAQNITYKLIGRACFRRTTLGRDENHLFVVYEIQTDDTLMLGNEAMEIVSFTDDALKRALRDTPEEFGEAYYFVLETFYPGYLPETWEKRWS